MKEGSALLEAAGESLPAALPAASARGFWMFSAMVAVLCGWVLSLPVFPMQDGPMHLYLATVLHDLMGSTPSVFARYYVVQHVLPPYSLHYYFLIGLMQFVSAAWAEKIVVCTILACICFGCRYLAKANGRSGAVLSFFSLAIALNWPLMMGFQNYVLSLALACWTLGLWARMAQAQLWSKRALFVGLCFLVAITHPVPLVLVLGFCAVDLALGGLLRSGRVNWRKDAVAFVVASSLVLYLRAFTDKHRSAEDFHATESVATRLHYFFGLHGLEFLNTAGVGARLQQVSLYVVLAVLLYLAVRAMQQGRRAGWSSARTWFVVTVVLTAALPFLPDDLSGSKALVSRLQVVTFVGLMAAASGLPRLGDAWRRGVMLLGVVSAVGTLSLCQARLLPIARRIAPVQRDVLNDGVVRGQAGLLLSAHAMDEASFGAVTYEPLHWQAANYFRRTGTVLLNPPWMDSTWLPLAAQPALLTSRFSPWTMECYQCLRKKLVESAEVRGEVLPVTDFIVFVDQAGTAKRPLLDEVLAARLPDGSRFGWACSAHDWYWVCRKTGGAL